MFASLLSFVFFGLSFLCKSHLYGWIYPKNIKILKLILQGFLWKFFFESQTYKKIIKTNCDKFGMICITRWGGFHYLILIILENHIYDATF